MYLYWVSNKWYTIKDIGSVTPCLDKFIFGVLISSVILFLVIGPFYIFCSLSPLVTYNEVLDGQIKLAFQINKTIGFMPAKGRVEENANKLNSSYENITSSLPYEIYNLKNPFLKTLDEDMWRTNKFSNKTETRDF